MLLILSSLLSVFMMSVVLVVGSKSSWFMVFWLVMMSVSVGGLFWLTTSKWLMLIIILLYVGGMMVLFSYMLSLSSFSKPAFGYESVIYILFAFVLFKMGPFLMDPGFQAVDMYGLQGGVLGYISCYLLLVLILSVKAVNLSVGSLKSLSD